MFYCQFTVYVLCHGEAEGFQFDPDTQELNRHTRNTVNENASNCVQIKADQRAHKLRVTT
jgi:hypothetical protein